jgi:hypothetical protein
LKKNPTKVPFTTGFWTRGDSGNCTPQVSTDTLLFASSA